MNKNKLTFLELGLLVVIVPIIATAVLVGAFTHDSSKGWDVYMSGIKFITAPLFQVLENAVNAAVPK